MMLPLSHRVLLALRLRPYTVRELARQLGSNYASVDNVLRGLQTQGKLQRSLRDGDVALWRLAPGVQVEYRPATVSVTGGSTPPIEGPMPKCSAIGSKGWPCRMPAAYHDRCYVHAERPEHFQN